MTNQRKYRRCIFIHSPLESWHGKRGSIRIQRITLVRGCHNKKASVGRNYSRDWNWKYLWTDERSRLFRVLKEAIASCRIANATAPATVRSRRFVSEENWKCFARDKAPWFKMYFTFLRSYVWSDPTAGFNFLEYGS